MADLEIFVFILRDSPPSKKMFPVAAPASMSVGNWKGLVHHHGPSILERCKPADLTLWKVRPLFSYVV
jgi:hypothetical protein